MLRYLFILGVGIALVVYRAPIGDAYNDFAYKNPAVATAASAVGSRVRDTALDISQRIRNKTMELLREQLHLMVDDTIR